MRIVGANERRISKDEAAASMARSVNFWGEERDRKQPANPWFREMFWGRYFRPIDAKYLAQAEEQEKAGKENIWQRLILQKTRDRMRQSKEPFALHNTVWVEAQAEITRLKAKFALLDGDKFFSDPSGSRAELSVVET